MNRLLYHTNTGRNDAFAEFLRAQREGGVLRDTDLRLLEAFYFACRIRNLSPRTLKCYADRLKLLCVYAVGLNRGLDELDQLDIQRYIVSQLGKVADETVNGRIRVWKRLFNWAVDEGQLAESPMRRVSFVKVDRQIKPVLTPEQVGKVLKGFKGGDFHKIRNAAMVMVTYDAMLRTGELLSMKLVDLHLVEHYIVVTRSKSRQQRFVPISSRTAQMVHRYLLRYREKMHGDWLWLNEKNGRLYEHSWYQICYRCGKRLRIKLYPHLLRHSGATQYIRSGGSPVILQQVLGHRSALTTQIYLHLNREDAIFAHESHSPAMAIPA